MGEEGLGTGSWNRGELMMMMRGEGKRPVRDQGLKVTVIDGEFDKALNIFRKKVKRAGLISELRERRYFRSKSEIRRKARREAVRRRKRAELDSERTR